MASSARRSAGLQQQGDRLDRSPPADLLVSCEKEYHTFPTPRNFNYFWNFGAIATVMLVLMIATGIVLAMNYTPHVTMAFDSVERIMRDVQLRAG